MTYEERIVELWEQWTKDTENTNDPAEWDKIFESYTDAIEAVNVEFNHPSGRPRRRP